MAMLAEPRQRKRYNLAPRGKALYEDDSRFGTKMLEKMGWSKGKGLGPKEDGSQEFVRVRYKNDIQGLGFEQRDDQWTQHENSFSGLLKSLNGDKSDAEANTVRETVESEDDIPRVGFGFQNGNEQQCTKKEKKSKLKEKISGVSLEEKSKQSKARVHYKKFTRGKDLSQYSETDLANIFGRKAADEQESAAADLYQQLNETFNHNDTKEEEKVISENFGGVQTISTGLSVSDYFKMKMSALKNRTIQTNGESKECVNNVADAEGEIINEELKKKKKKKRDARSIECEDTAELPTVEGTSLDEEALKKKKKKKKDRSIECDDAAELPVVEAEGNTLDEETLKKKKKKKSDRSIECKDAAELLKGKHTGNEANKLLANVVEIPNNNPQKKKKRTKECEVTPVVTEDIEVSSENMEFASNSHKKKKQKKSKEHTRVEASNEESVECIHNIASDAKNTIESNLNGVLKSKNSKSKKNQHSEQHLSEVPPPPPAEDIVADCTNIENVNRQKEKSKKRANSPDNSANTEVSKKTKRNAVSDCKQLTDTDNVNALNLQDLEANFKLTNVYRLSSFCAEKFRNLNLDYFPESSLPLIEGYGLNKDIQLQIQPIKTDEMRITKLWDNTLSKYALMEKETKKNYQKYVKETFKARKLKQKRPSLHFKSYKRKNAFAIV